MKAYFKELPPPPPGAFGLLGTRRLPGSVFGSRRLGASGEAPEDVFEKYAATFEKLGVNANNGLGASEVFQGGHHRLSEPFAIENGYRIIQVCI